MAEHTLDPDASGRYHEGGVHMVDVNPSIAERSNTTTAIPTVVPSLTFSSGGASPIFNLTPGTVSIVISADQMTMAYLRDLAGVTWATVVAGPNPGATTVAIGRAGQYRLDIWGFGNWTAIVSGDAVQVPLAPADQATIVPQPS
jgi:hypothetical protein